MISFSFLGKKCNKRMRNEYRNMLGGKEESMMMRRENLGNVFYFGGFKVIKQLKSTTILWTTIKETG